MYYWYLLDFEYIKSHYRLIAVDLSRQVDTKAIQQIEFIGQLKKLDNNDNATNAGYDQSMLVLTILEKIKETRLKFSQGSLTVFKNMVNYQEVKVKLTNT